MSTTAPQSSGDLKLTPGDVEPNWLYFVARSGEVGQQWAEEYSSAASRALLDAAFQALALLRRRQLEAGEARLRVAKTLLRQLERAAPPTFLALQRWYYGALAYNHYCREDFEAAERVLDQAHAAVRDAIDAQRFLIPFARDCFDFTFQRCRISRSRRRWQELHHRLEITCDVVEGRRPYCVLRDGTLLDLAAVRRFYDSLPALTAEERESLRPVYDEDLRRQRFLREVHVLYAFSGLVVPYIPSPKLLNAITPAGASLSYYSARSVTKGST